MHSQFRDTQNYKILLETEKTIITPEKYNKLVLLMKKFNKLELLLKIYNKLVLLLKKIQ